jgi:hypothetical protein
MTGRKSGTFESLHGLLNSCYKLSLIFMPTFASAYIETFHNVTIGLMRFANVSSNTVTIAVLF